MTGTLKTPNTREQMAEGHVPEEHDPLLRQAALWLHETYPEGVYENNHDNPGYWRLHRQISLDDMVAQTTTPWARLVKVFEENRFVPADSPSAITSQRRYDPFRMPTEEKALLTRDLIQYKGDTGVSDILQEILLLAGYREAAKEYGSAAQHITSKLDDALTSRVDIVATRINQRAGKPTIAQDNLMQFGTEKAAALTV